MVDTHIHEFLYRFEGSLKYLQQRQLPNALYTVGPTLSRQAPTFFFLKAHTVYSYKPWYIVAQKLLDVVGLTTEMPCQVTFAPHCIQWNVRIEKTWAEWHHTLRTCFINFALKCIKYWISRSQLNKDRPAWCHLFYYFTIYCSTCFEC